MMEKPKPHVQALPALAFFSFQKILRSLYRPLWQAIDHWIDAGGMRMSAAMSFYGILSLAPLLVLLVAVLGWWLDRKLHTSPWLMIVGGVLGFIVGLRLLMKSVTGGR